jgi:hypothetical protein
MNKLKIKIIVYARHNEDKSVYSATAYLIEPSRLPFDVVQTGTSKNLSSEEDAMRLALLNLKDRSINIYYKIIESALVNPTGILVEQRQSSGSKRANKITVSNGIVISKDNK